MMRAAWILVFSFVGCGGADQPAAEPSEPSAANTPTATYDLHEWGLLTVTPEVVELAAGPGTQPIVPADVPQMVVEKPVVYVHASGELRFTLDVRLGDGYALAERWPGTGSPLRWEARVTPGACAGQTTYPTSCESADGYCEVRELATYEASDASCLEVGSQRAPLLFYRLRAEPEVAAALPMRIEDSSVSARSSRVAWRVRRNAAGIQTWRVDLDASGTELPESSAEGAPAAAAWMHHELERRGLTDPERAAFERAWWPVLFGINVDVVETPEVVEEVVEEAVVEEDIQEQSAPFDTLLYFLEDAEIGAIARLDATPSPRHVRRAFVVRHRL